MTLSHSAPHTAPESHAPGVESAGDTGDEHQPEPQSQPSPLAPAPGIECALPCLSPRLQEVWYLLADGKSNSEIAGTLNLTLNTVKSYIRKLYNQLHVHRRSQATKLWHDMLDRRAAPPS